MSTLAPAVPQTAVAVRRPARDAGSAGVPVRRERLELEAGEMDGAALEWHEALADGLAADLGIYRKTYRRKTG